MKIGLLGGTFDPVHNGHYAVAENALRHLNLDKVIFIPCGIPPHKPPWEITPAHIRLQMVWSVAKENPLFECSDYEIKSKKPSYSIDTVRFFLKRIEKKDLFFIIGADSLYDLHTWKDIDGLVRLCQIAVVVRKGFCLKDITARDTHLSEETFHECLKQVIEMKPVDLSSTEIRRKVAAGESIHQLVPECIESFISTRGLYRGGATL